MTTSAKFYLITTYEYEAGSIVDYDTLDELLNVEKIYHPQNHFFFQTVIQGTELDLKTLNELQNKETP